MSDHSRDVQATETNSIPLDRRTFVRLSAATAGAIAIPTSLAETSSDTLEGSTELYDFVRKQVDDEYTIPTLVTLTEPAFDVVEPYATDRFRTTTTPQPAAWLKVAATTARSLRDHSVVDQLQYAPGSNPFWQLGQYPDGIFPSPDRAVDFIDYEQMIDGIDQLIERHGDRIRMRSAGESPGHRNLFTDSTDSKQLRVVELTENVRDPEAFAAKEKALFVLSIHGDERSGTEAGCRFIERLLEGEDPAIASLLDEIALVFAFANPDGWVARNQQYAVDLDGDGTTEHNSFRRETATGVDPNRQYPTAGWIDPVHFPAEPAGENLTDDRPGVDTDCHGRYRTVVPDALSIVDFFRSYEKLEIGTDLHGMFTSENFIEGLLVNDQYDNADFHEIYEWNRQLERRLEATLGDRLADNRERFEALNERLDASTLPARSYDYGTIFDTIQYTTTGTLISWMSQPEETGGLDMTMMAHEMGWDNRALSRRPYLPWLTELWVAGYQAVIRATVEQLDSTVSATIDHGGRSTAVVTTDGLTRRSSALSFVDTDKQTETVTLTGTRRPATQVVSVPDGATQLSVSIEHTTPVRCTLRDPNRGVYATYNALADRHAAEWTIDEPVAGEWTVTYKTVGPTATADIVCRSTVVTGNLTDSVTAPDPVATLGYQQRPYAVSPQAYFDSYAAAMTTDTVPSAHSTGPVTEPLTDSSIEAIANGALLKGNSHRRTVDSVVISHDDGRSVDGYCAQLDAFVDAGGTLVLTDRGVSLLGDLETSLGAPFSHSAITDITIYIPFLSERNDDHPLLAGTRPIQRELWKVAPTGYALSVPGSAPLTVLDPDQFEAAGGTVAGYTHDDPFGIEGSPTQYVSAGSLTDDATGTIHCIGSLLPPAEQSNLHPFGLLEHTTTFLGHTMLTNALGYRQRRFVDGELVATFGSLS
ncbi:M14 family zinc carboxypeptidase [Halocatena halophila]|uniref:M14 family zinc carboxypeptidase n=1 Tax=Halocatena halophila TaxID=2814576 RepID=UPI002ED49AEB